MKKYILYTAVSAVTVMVAASGCVTNEGFSGKTYSREQVKTGNTVKFATIVSIEDAIIEGTSGIAGAIGGGVLGGALGSTIGGGSGRTVATAAGAAGGALLGKAVEGAATRRSALEITVKYQDSNQMEAIVQEAGSDVFQVGQNVRVLIGSDGTKRVRPQ